MVSVFGLKPMLVPLIVITVPFIPSELRVSLLLGRFNLRLPVAVPLLTVLKPSAFNKLLLSAEFPSVVIPVSSIEPLTRLAPTPAKLLVKKSNAD